MPSLPKRPGPYLLAFLLIILGILTYWMLRVLNDPAIQEAVQRTRAEKEKGKGEKLPEPGPPLRPPSSSGVSRQEMDAGILDMYAEMVEPKTPPEREVEILHELIAMEQRAMGPGSFGDNGDVTRALVGESVSGAWLPRNSLRIRDGLLLDRWSTPYWFHANGGNQLEIRSAGPDKELFTPDDIILNGSPAGFGATPSQP